MITDHGGTTPDIHRARAFSPFVKQKCPEKYSAGYFYNKSVTCQSNRRCMVIGVQNKHKAIMPVSIKLANIISSA
jgi:hypothetical protein